MLQREEIAHLRVWRIVVGPALAIVLWMSCVLLLLCLLVVVVVMWLMDDFDRVPL
jgi:hypothetical protein